MRICDYTLPSVYDTSWTCDEDEEEILLDLAEALQSELWSSALSILQNHPIDPSKRDPILLEALERLEEETCLYFVETVRRHGPLPAKTDSRILEIAAKRRFLGLAALQLQEGLIQPWGADSALKIAAENNHRTLVNLLLGSPLCSQRGKNQAALSAVEWGATGSIAELLKKEAVSGDVIQDSCPICICSCLIFIAGKKGYWDIADMVATYKLDTLGLKLSRADLIYLASAAAGDCQIDFLQEILKLLGDLSADEREILINAAKRYGHDVLLPLFDLSEETHCQAKRHQRCHSY